MGGPAALFGQGDEADRALAKKLLDNIRRNEKAPALRQAPGDAPAPLTARRGSLPLEKEKEKETRSYVREKDKEKDRKEGGSFKIDDSSLVASMAGRMQSMEAELRKAKRELQEAKVAAKSAKEEIKLLKTAASESSSLEMIRELQEKNAALAMELTEVHAFLEDYGLTWVGENGGKAQKELAQAERDKRREEARDTQAVLTATFDYNLGALRKHVKDLSLLAECDASSIVKSEDGRGAHFKKANPIQLTIFKNGFRLDEGEFRPYNRPSNRAFMQDLSDGYFPFEFKEKYPEGVPLYLTDLSYKVCQESEFAGKLQGGLQRVGAAVKENLPQSLVSANGEIISVRDAFRSLDEGPKRVDITSTTTNTTGGHPPPHLNEKNDDSHRFEVEGVVSGESVGLCTLALTAPDGKVTFTVKLPAECTIGELRNSVYSHVEDSRPASDAALVLRTAFPAAVFDDNEATLLEVGLFPNARVFLQWKR